MTPSEPASSESRDDEVLAVSTSPAAVRSDEGPGISDTDDEASRRRAGDAGREAFESVRATRDKPR